MVSLLVLVPYLCVHVSMDHITYPQQAAVRPITIPYYVLPEHLYDGQGLDKFPSRKGISWPSPSSVTPELQADIRRVLNNSLSFVQSWLFFALIEECHKLLTPFASKYVRDNYLVDNGVDRRTTTAPISQLLLNWEIWDRQLRDHQRRPILHEVKENLEMAVGFATGLMELTEHVHQLGWIAKTECTVVEELTLCIYCLCEALGKPGMIYRVNFSKLNTSEPGILSERFRQSGLCPKDIKFLDYQTFTVRYAASALDRRFDANLHGDCTANSCVHERMDEKLYVRTHARDCDTNKCFDVTSRSAGAVDVSAILLKDDVPLVRLSDHGDDCDVLRMIEHGQKTRIYVAISHVWSE